jgi:MFS superfamily sulfate permease-like transporter
MKSTDAKLMMTGRERQRGMITSSCGLALLLMALIIITATPNLFVFVPSAIQHVIVAVLAGQLVGWIFSGQPRSE